MADTTNSGRSRPATTTKTTPRKAGATSTRRRTTTSTQPRTRVEAAQVLAERAVLVPVGAGLLARDNLVSTVRGFATKYRTRASAERELKRYERRGVSARNRFERQVRRTRTKFDRTVRQNRRRVEREVSSVRRDLERQSGTIGARMEKFVSEAQGRLNPLS